MYNVFLAVVCCGVAPQLFAAPTASDILTDSGVAGGLDVVVGCDDSELVSGLAARAGYLVQGLDTRSERHPTWKQNPHGRWRTGQEVRRLWPKKGGRPGQSHSTAYLLVK